VVQLLEKLNVPYTGANAVFYDPSRLEMKKVALSKGFKTPAWFDVKVKSALAGHSTTFHTRLILETFFFSASFCELAPPPSPPPLSLLIFITAHAFQSTCVLTSS
jgi:hypothetical protein